MELINLSQCNKSFSFYFKNNETRNTHASFLPVSIEKELLTGFSISEDSTVINYHRDDFKTYKEVFELIRKIQGDLSFVELVRFFHKWVQYKIFSPADILSQSSVAADPLLISQIYDPVLFFSFFGFRYNENLKLTIDKILLLSESFQEWCSIKKWGPQDFAPLRALTEIESVNPYLDQLSASLLSKTESTQIFELLVELLLLENENLKSLFNTPCVQWPKKLKEWRYPVQTEQIEIEDAQIKKLPWPMNAQVKWMQKGDRSGIELKMFFSHPQELDRAILRLQQIAETFKTDPEAQKMWSLE